jgi:hypothetical protein
MIWEKEVMHKFWIAQFFVEEGAAGVRNDQEEEDLGKTCWKSL